MICYSPQINYRMPYNNVGIGIPFQYGFKMDGVKDLLNLSKVAPAEFRNFTLYPDPEFEKFTNQMKSHTRKNDKILIISVSLLTLSQFLYYIIKSCFSKSLLLNSFRFYLIY